MPVYEFRCSGCGQRATRLARRIEAPVDTTCERCGGTLERVPSSFALHKTLKTQVEELDPKYDKMIEAADTIKGDDPLERLGLNRPAPPAE